MSEGFLGYDPQQDVANNYIDLNSCAVCLPLAPDLRKEMAENYSNEVGLFAQAVTEVATYGILDEPMQQGYSANPGCF